MEGVGFSYCHCVISHWCCLLVWDRVLDIKIFFFNTLTHTNTCIYMVFSLVCIRGKLLVLWMPCNSCTYDPQPLHFQKCINTREWMFLQSPAPFNILYSVTSWFGKANLELYAQNTKTFPPFHMTGRRLKTCFPGNKEKKLPVENKHLKWFNLHRINIVRGRLSSLKYGR